MGIFWPKLPRFVPLDVVVRGDVWTAVGIALVILLAVLIVYYLRRL